MPSSAVHIDMSSEELRSVFAEIVDQAADEGEQWTAGRRAKGKPVALTHYDSATVVNLATADYLKRWSRHLRLPKAVFVVASVYLDRFVEKRKVSITHYNKFRALLCCLVTADKFLNDKCVVNKEYAKVGGVAPEELNHLERMFLADIRFGLYVSNSLYEQYCEAFEEHLDEREEDALSSLRDSPPLRLSSQTAPDASTGTVRFNDSSLKSMSLMRLSQLDHSGRSFVDAKAFASSLNMRSANDIWQ
eukprot:TRINITY_DN5404_c0_g1_i6.p1 TRINITY_DN5404_c0_g1~~TRINITY_DN5404_c0_g1_i6.p1  ORF type:complete len:247 (+),score=67.07 TRINITY_DN5404_c0_g1_i6:52-792(+)